MPSFRAWLSNFLASPRKQTRTTTSTSQHPPFAAEILKTSDRISPSPPTRYSQRTSTIPSILEDEEPPEYDVDVDVDMSPLHRTPATPLYDMPPSSFREARHSRPPLTRNFSRRFSSSNRFSVASGGSEASKRFSQMSAGSEESGVSGRSARARWSARVGSLTPLGVV